LKATARLVVEEGLGLLALEAPYQGVSCLSAYRKTG
jgi:hypothetical protein